jgi:hypothetical protein
MGRFFYSLTSKVYCGDAPDHSEPGIGTQPRVATFSDRGSKPDLIPFATLNSEGLIPAAQYRLTNPTYTFDTHDTYKNNR